MTEDELLIGVTDLLTARNWRWVHYRRSDQAKMMGHAGLPDIIAVSASRRRLLFIELKTVRGRIDDEQYEWLGAFQAVAGVVVDEGSLTGHRMPEVYVWRPIDWLDDTIDRLLR